MIPCPICQKTPDCRWPAHCGQCGWDLTRDLCVTPSLIRLDEAVLDAYAGSVRRYRQQWGRKQHALAEANAGQSLFKENESQLKAALDAADMAVRAQEPRAGGDEAAAPVSGGHGIARDENRKSLAALEAAEAAYRAQEPHAGGDEAVEPVFGGHGIDRDENRKSLAALEAADMAARAQEPRAGGYEAAVPVSGGHGIARDENRKSLAALEAADMAARALYDCYGEWEDYATRGGAGPKQSEERLEYSDLNRERRSSPGEKRRKAALDEAVIASRQAIEEACRKMKAGSAPWRLTEAIEGSPEEDDAGYDLAASEKDRKPAEFNELRELLSGEPVSGPHGGLYPAGEASVAGSEMVGDHRDVRPYASEAADRDLSSELVRELGRIEARALDLQATSVDCRKWAEAAGTRSESPYIITALRALDRLEQSLDRIRSARQKITGSLASSERVQMIVNEASLALADAERHMEAARQASEIARREIRSIKRRQRTIGLIWGASLAGLIVINMLINALE